MKRLRHQIIESFFNPVLHFLPLMIYILLEDFKGENYAFKVALGVNAILLAYVYLRYKRIILWYIISTAIFLTISTAIIFLRSIAPVIDESSIFGELVVLILFSTSLLFRKTIEKIVLKNSPRNFSMLNNLGELFRLMTIISVIIVIYLLAEILTPLSNNGDLIHSKNFIREVFIVVLIFALVYEIIRVSLVRIRLFKEEWWPVVNEQGKKIGSIHSMISIKDEHKYMHPIIRVILIDKNKIFLQKRRANDLYLPNVWDTAISNHIRLNEKIEQCIVRTSYERCGVKGIKPVFLTHYVSETPVEFVYSYLFVACEMQSINPDPQFFEATKWWTIKQIEENLNSGIFSDMFILEYNYLKRSGLISSGLCSEDCSLKKNIKDRHLKKSAV